MPSLAAPKRTCVLRVRMTKQEIAALRKMAIALGVTSSDVVRLMLTRASLDVLVHGKEALKTIHDLKPLPAPLPGRRSAS